MDFNNLKNELEKSVNMFKKIEAEKSAQIDAELDSLDQLLMYLMPVLPNEIINGKRAVLIYVFEDSAKKTISNKVFYCEDKKVRYQVFKKEEYKGYNPEVEYEGAYAVVEANKMFQTIDLSDVLDFFSERVETLPEMAKDMSESTLMRKNFLDQYKKFIFTMK